jgi:cytoskeletal protein CcmA (bactofilin family)
MFKGSSNKTETVNSPDKLNRLVEGTLVKGEVRTDSNFRLDGELVGTLNTLGKLVVGPTGRIEGEIVCGNADIEGEVVGNIKVDGILVLKSTARFKGNIIAQKIGMENGAEFNGTCQMGGDNNVQLESPVIPQVGESQLVY